VIFGLGVSLNQALSAGGTNRIVVGLARYWLSQPTISGSQPRRLN
jgi:hypothetical protein